MNLEDYIKLRVVADDTLPPGVVAVLMGEPKYKINYSHPDADHVDKVIVDTGKDHGDVSDDR